MLEGMGPEQFLGWYQYYRLHPWGSMEDWRRTSVQTARTVNLIRESLYKNGHIKMSPQDWIPDNEFIPASRKKKPKQRRLTADQGFGMMRARIGV